MSLTQDACFADHARFAAAVVSENVLTAKATRRIRLHAPEIARASLPGQFYMVRIAGCNDPLLGRPLALYDIWEESGAVAGIDLVYLVKGKFTQRLARVAAGEEVEIWGPLGNGFRPRPAEHLIAVAGGIGHTPFPAVIREALGQHVYGSPRRHASPVKKVSLCYGVRTAELFSGVDDFQKIGAEVRLCTDDGTAGHLGPVTDLLRELLAESHAGVRIVCCGPEPMMEAVAEIALAENVPCEVSLETPMACGIGICFTCVAKVRQENGEWDYRRTCVEGPVFEASRIVW